MALGEKSDGSGGADVSTSAPHGDTFFLDDFAQRQWDDPDYSGTRMSSNKADFVRTVEEVYEDGAKLVDGYADFCKHLFIPNFVGAHAGHLHIDRTNEGLLRSGYKARSASELPVLSRWFPSDQVKGHETKMLDIILYSRSQLLLEQKATAARKGLKEKDLPPLPDAPWGIISIKAQDEDFELPMSPITIMRNALGAEEGGSGVPLDREAYLASVKYWDQHAMIQ
ncbi:hypothetical protein KFL_000280470 [Klebsormidium nitens]|uniref:Flagellar associated protein n=1 Tax=Klebsormidium nitens TaxID=105231 RepID=A0A1Y1HNM9_KLENI|nr:hypothetical protein KFL_000280470 [Klebsormidium nitens]|eukprot:GAQ79342.1 hypothetical protein KFL_000280470 [Klebsormidium nitens]